MDHGSERIPGGNRGADASADAGRAGDENQCKLNYASSYNNAEGGGRGEKEEVQ